METVTLTEEVIDAAEYFAHLGYQVTPDFPEQFFRCVSAMPDEDRKSRNEVSKYEDLFCALLSKSADEYQNFHNNFSAFLERKRIVSESEYATAERTARSMKERAENEAASAEKVLAEIRKDEKEIEKYQKLASEKQSVFTDEEKKKAEKKFSKAGAELAKASGMSEKKLRSLYEGTLTKNDLKKYREKLKKSVAKAVLSDSRRELTALIKLLASMTETAEERLNQNPAAKLGEAKKRCQDHKKEYESHMRNAESCRNSAQEISVVKAQSKRHRHIFVPGGNGVSSGFKGETESLKVLEKEFKKLRQDDFVKIRDYLRDHAQQFRTRVSRNVRTSSGRRIDFPETCRKACATGGVPVRLELIKPKRQKTSILMILDVSGSCRSASVIMMTFMQTMSEVFRGGCHSFAFVNSLYDITDGFADGDEPAQILSEIPTKGVYSDYEKPLRQFYSEKMALVSSDTIVVFIGDARNNRRPSGEEYMKNICRKAKSAYWINTEPQNRWDTGDSVMSAYMPYMKKCAPVLTTAQLLEFLMEVK